MELFYFSTERHGSNSRWMYIADKGAFLQAAEKANAARTPTKVIAFVTQAEANRADFSGAKLRCTAADAFGKLAVVDRRFSATGMTGRGVQFE